MSKTAFERYAPFIQEFIYRKRWSELREVQVEACDAILDTDKHVIIASGTASGKTEAAFFPILTILERQPSQSIGVMYISPLKALINDQFERLNELLDENNIPVWPWHGDISQSVKKKALKTAQGIIQITPESLEALLMSHPGDAQRLFSDLRFIVIDEIHALMGEDRGLQVLCLLSRLEKMAECNPRRVGLSATLNDYRPAMEFLSSGTSRDVVSAGIQNHNRTISLCVESFDVPDDQEQALDVLENYKRFLYDNCHDKKCLIFANTRKATEAVIADMKEIAAQRKEPDVFFVHHASVSASLRQETEHFLRDSRGPAVAAATLTLELGIDIGDLDCIIQLGAPNSCSSFVQRLGRSGRRSGKSQMMFTDLHFEKHHNNMLDILPWKLLRSIAIIQLYLEERWVEPFSQKEKPFSLLAHQTLSALMTYGELSPAELAQNVLLLPPFKNTISTDEYRDLLRFMLKEEYLQRLANGGIIVGLKGEKYTNYYTFYSVFKSEDSYRVVSKNGEIGTLAEPPASGEAFLLAGKAWQVESVDYRRKIIFVAYAHGKRVGSWHGSQGEISARIAQRMKQVLEEDTIYKYLQPSAQNILSNARDCAHKIGLLERSVLQANKNSIVMCPWTGTKELRTIKHLLAYSLNKQLTTQGIKDCWPYLQIPNIYNVDKFIESLRVLDVDFNDPDAILARIEATQIDKYDFMVPDNLLRSAFLHNQMDVPAALQILRSLK